MVVILTALASNVWIFRMLLKQTADPAFHSDQSATEAEPPASTQNNAGR